MGCVPTGAPRFKVGGATATTDSTGRYSLTLQPGQVSASASAAGYQTGTKTAALNDYFPNQLDFFLFPVPPCPQSTTDPSLTICKPLNNSTVTSPVNVVAGVNSSAPINSFSIWLDGIKVYSTPGVTLNTNVTISPGKWKMNLWE